MADIDPDSPESRRLNNKDRSFTSLKLHFLSIKINHANGLKAADRTLKGGSSDPFVDIIANDQKYTTQTIMKNLNPIWNEETTFCFFDFVKQIDFKVFDWDKGTKHDRIGECTIDTSKYFTKGHNGFTGDLALHNPDKGTINVSVKGKLIIPKELEDRCVSFDNLKSQQSNEINNKESQLTQLKEKNNDLSLLKDSYLKEKNELATQLESLQNDEENAKKQNIDTKNNIQSVKDEIEKNEQRIQDFGKQRDALNGKIDSCKDDVNKEQANKHNLLEKIETLQREFTK